MFDIVNPRQVILVSSRAEMELMGKTKVKDNIFTLTWHTPISFEPMMYGILVSKDRFSYEMINKSKVFVVNFMPESMKEKILFCGRNTGEAVDKFAETGFEKKEAEAIDCPIIGDASGYLECELLEEHEIGDHVLFVGKVVREKEAGDSKRLFYKGSNCFTTTR